MTKNEKYEKGMVYSIKIDELKPDPNQPRKYFDPEALNELEKSIKQYGVLQPILFRVDKDGNKIVVAGERRYQATKNNGSKEIPSMYIEGNHVEIAMVENLLRQNLSPIEEAEALQKMKDEFKYTDMGLSKVIGKARSTVVEILSLNKLPEEIRNQCRNKYDLPKDKLLEISKAEKKEDMTVLYEKMLRENLSRSDLRKLRSQRKKKWQTPKVKEIERKTSYQDDNSTSGDIDKKLSEVVELAEKLLELLKKKEQLPEDDRKTLAGILKEIDKLSVYWYG